MPEEPIILNTLANGIYQHKITGQQNSRRSDSSNEPPNLKIRSKHQLSAYKTNIFKTFNFTNRRKSKAISFRILLSYCIITSALSSVNGKYFISSFIRDSSANETKCLILFNDMHCHIFVDPYETFLTNKRNDTTKADHNVFFLNIPDFLGGSFNTTIKTLL